jgi:hypothetical protein
MVREQKIPCRRPTPGRILLEKSDIDKWVTGEEKKN